MFKTKKKYDTEITSVADISEKFGKYQILQYFYASLPAVFVSMINVNYIFVAGDVRYRCRIRECESSNTTYSVSWWPNHTNQCTRPILNQTYLDKGECSYNSFTGAMEQCTDWVYENHDTIVSKLNLACQPWKKTMVGTIHNIGMTIAELWAGWLSDIYGRKTIMIICALGCVIGNFKTLASSYSVYVSLEFLEALICGGIYIVGGVLILEIAPNKNRVFAGVLFSYAIYLGEAIFALLGIVVPYWKTLIYTICSPTILFIFYFIIVNESLRWLILKGKISQAKEILKKMVQMNNINTDMEELNSMDNEKLKAVFKFGKTEIKRQGMKQVYQCRPLFIWFLIISFSRFTVGFVYYGLLINSVVLPGDKHTNFLLAALMSFPGELLCLFLMNKIGRRVTLISGFLLFGVAWIVSGYVSENYVWLKICLFLLTKLAASACYTGIATFAMELFPTSVRGLLLGLCTVASSLGNMLAPLSPLLTPLVASILFGCLAIISSALLYFTPETKDLPLMDTIEQVSDSFKATKNKNISFNLACQPWKRTMVGTVHNIGMTIAQLWAGWMADFYGRKTTLIIGAIGCVIGNFKTLASSYPVYVSLEFMEALISGGIYTVGGVLMLELAGNNNRMLAGVVFSCAIYWGEALFAIFGEVVPYWKTLIYVICSPPILFIFYCILLNESSRWLIVKGKTSQAVETLKKMVKMNNINTDMEELNTIDDEKLKRMLHLLETETKQGMKQVYQCRPLFIWFLIMSFCRFTVSFVYYGLLVNSVVLPGEKHSNFFLAALMSFPGEFISLFLMNKIGRRVPLISGFLLFGVACIASGYVPHYYVWLKICLFLISKLVASVCFTGVATYAMELFPTSVRGLLLGLCTVASSLGNMLAPLSPFLTPLVASIIFGCLAIISSALLHFTPETKDSPLMDTIEHVTDSIKNRKTKCIGIINLGYAGYQSGDYVYQAN